MVMVRQVSSAKLPHPETTRLGRNRFMGTGSDKRPFKSASEASLMTRQGYPSAKLTASPSRPPFEVMGRRHNGSIQARWQGSPKNSESHRSAAGAAAVALTSSFQMLTVRRGSPVGGLRSRGGRPATVKIRPSGCNRVLIRARAGWLRWLIKRPSGPTMTQRRSLARPSGCAVAVWISTPPRALTG